MKTIMLMVLLVFMAAPAFGVVWKVELTKDGVTQSERVVTPSEIKDVNVASVRTTKGVFNYFWEAMNDMFRQIEAANVAAQQAIDLEETKTRMRQ